MCVHKYINIFLKKLNNNLPPPIVKFIEVIFNFQNNAHTHTPNIKNNKQNEFLSKI
jgi:hypothetical protein